MYFCSLFICCLLYTSHIVLALNDGVHVLALKSYRESAMPSSASNVHANGILKLVAGDDDTQSEAGDENKDDDTDVADTDGKAPSLPADTYGPGSAILESDNNILWYTTIVIGTGEGKKEFTVDVDTGSADLFIPGSDCKSSCDGHARYDPKSSPTSNDTSDAFTLNFADKSSVEGTVYTDTVNLGGLVAKNQGFGVGKTYSEGLGKKIFTPDGLLGLGFDTLSRIKSTPLLDTLYNQGQIKQRVFGVRLDLAEADGDQGELTLGGYNEQHVIGDVAYAPVNDDKFWQVGFDQVSVENRIVASKRNFIVDTGSTLINADRHAVRQVYSKIPGARRVPNSHHWTLPCKNIPTLVFTIAGTEFTIDPSNFSPGRVSEHSDNCYGGLVEGVGVKDPWIVGGVFLSSVYTVFDVDQKRIGFAVLKDPKSKDH